MKISPQHHQVLSKHLPEEAIDQVYQLMKKYPLRFLIKQPRHTKLGDYHPNKNGKPQITINNNLNPFSFLITTIHEFAHHIVYLNFKNNVKPHGVEWQKTYRELLLPFINQGIFPNRLEKVLLESLIKVKASSCSDVNLLRELQKYDQNNDENIYLEDLALGDKFSLNGKTFKLGKLRRSRYLCSESVTNRVYLVHALAKVKKINNE